VVRVTTLSHSQSQGRVETVGPQSILGFVFHQNLVVFVERLKLFERSEN